MDTITERQRAYAVNLLTERLVTLKAASIEEAIERLHLDSLTKADARTVIDRLLKLPADPDLTMPEVVAKAHRKGTNGRPGVCTSCKHVVAEGAGYWYTKATGGFAEHHKLGECSTEPVVAAPEPEVGGLYMVTAGHPVLVYKTGNGHLAGKTTQGGRYRYCAGAIMQVRAGLVDGTAHRVTAQEAREYGYTNSHCINCGEALSDPRSDPAKGGAGYGPTCARRNGWPWGK